MRKYDSRAERQTAAFPDVLQFGLGEGEFLAPQAEEPHGNSNSRWCRGKLSERPCGIKGVPESLTPSYSASLSIFRAHCFFHIEFY